MTRILIDMQAALNAAAQGSAALQHPILATPSEDNRKHLTDANAHFAAAALSVLNALLGERAIPSVMGLSAMSCPDEGCPHYGTGATCKPKTGGCIATVPLATPCVYPGGADKYDNIGQRCTVCGKVSE